MHSINYIHKYWKKQFTRVSRNNVFSFQRKMLFWITRVHPQHLRPKWCIKYCTYYVTGKEKTIAGINSKSSVKYNKKAWKWKQNYKCLFRLVSNYYPNIFSTFYICTVHFPHFITMKICYIVLRNKSQKTFPGISSLLNTQSSDHTYRLEEAAPLLLHKVTFSTFSKSWNSPSKSASPSHFNVNICRYIQLLPCE